MSLSPRFLDELRSRTLLSALIGRTVKLTRAGREWKACCPFHHEKSPSFTVNDDKGFYHCFGCSAHGDAIRWMTDQRGLPFIDAVKELAAAAGMEMPAPDPQAQARAQRQADLHDVMAAAAAWYEEQLFGEAGRDARAYLLGRGIGRRSGGGASGGRTLDESGPADARVAAFGLGYAPERRDGIKNALARFGEGPLIECGLLIAVDGKASYDRFRGRLMIPIRDPRGRVIGFGGRLLGPGEPKYLNSPDTPLFDKGRTLWNLDRAAPAARRTGRLIVVEGYMDAIALAGIGVDEVVAPLGTALTEAQLERMWRQVDRPTLCFDGDGAGQRAAMRAAMRALPMLTPGKTLDFVRLPAGYDPDDLIARLGAEAMRKALNVPISLVDLIWEAEASATEAASPDARAALKSRLDALVEQIADATIAREYRREFNDRFFNAFGWNKWKSSEKGQARWKPQDVSAVRAAIGQTRSGIGLSLADRMVRAILLGLCRYPAILRHDLEAVRLLPIANRSLDDWRKVIVVAIIERPDLDRDLIDTILHESDVSPIERWDLARDLGFSFCRRLNVEAEDEQHRRAEAELAEALAAVLADHELDRALASARRRLEGALARVGAGVPPEVIVNGDAEHAPVTHEGGDVDTDLWNEYQRLLTEQQAAKARLSEFAARETADRTSGDEGF